MKARMIVGTCSLFALAALLCGTWAASEDGLSVLSGSWSGTRKSEPQGTCKPPGDGFGPAALDFKIANDGPTTAKDSSGRRFEGTVASDRSVTLVLNGRSRCRVNGQMQDRQWSANYTGQITEEAGVRKMSLQGFESPCGECVFNIQYSLKKN